MNVMWSYANRIAFHIPHYAWIDGELKIVNYIDFKNAIFTLLEDMAINGAFSQIGKGYYRGREYEEEVLTVYVDASDMCHIINSYGSICAKYKEEMHQDKYAVELNGELLIFDNCIDKLLSRNNNV